MFCAWRPGWDWLLAPPVSVPQGSPFPAGWLPGCPVRICVARGGCGFSVWTAPGFDPASFERHALALQLVYRRGLVGEQIAERSLKEMRALPGFDASRAEAWLARMKTLFPDVSANDQLVGLYQPGVGVGFWLNGQPRGDVADPLFARLFMGIWLSPQTSEPRLRQALLGLAAP